MGHISGSLVLMADYSLKSNSDIRVGDIVLGADLIPSTVIHTIPDALTEYRRIMSFLESPHVRFVESDTLWAKDSERQWWWVENADMSQKKWRYMNANPLKIIDSYLVSYDVEFATLNGFENKTLVDVTDSYTPHTQLILIKTDRYSPIIINGHVVSSRLDEYIYDYTKFNWLDSYNQLLQSGKLELIKNNFNINSSKIN
jgi:hypothetical protein